MSSEEPQAREGERAQLDAHRAMVLWLFMATIVLSAGLSAVLFLADRSLPGEPTRPPVLLVVAAAGALGGFVSCLKRLYAFEDIFPRKQYAQLFKKLNAYLIAYSSIPPLVGMIAATVLYIVFAAELIKGPTFPAFACGLGEGLCVTFLQMQQSWGPATPADYAKAIVWGFIAGFSERYVVDILNQFGKDLDQSR